MDPHEGFFLGGGGEMLQLKRFSLSFSVQLIEQTIYVQEGF